MIAHDARHRRRTSAPRSPSACVGASLALLCAAADVDAGDCDVWVDFDGGISLGGSVATMQVETDELVVGGFFGDAGGMTANSIVRWGVAGWEPFVVDRSIGVSGASLPVAAMTLLNGDLVIGGNFTLAGGDPINRIARWDDQLQSWLPFGSGMNFGVLALVVHDGQLVAGGDFGNADSVLVQRIARWTGLTWEAFQVGNVVGVDDRVNVMIVYDDDLIIGGQFSTAGGVSVNGIARWDGLTWHPFAVDGNIGLGGSVRAMTIYEGDLVVGGSFGSTTGGETVNHIVRWDGECWQPFVDNSIAGIQGNGFVSALHVHDGQLVVGGSFGTAGGQLVRNVVRWDGAGWLAFDDGSNVGVNTTVSALTSFEGDLIVGGSFFTAGGRSIVGIARWRACAAPVPGDLDGDDLVGTTDLLLLIAAWGDCPDPPADCPADLDGSGAVDVPDLLLLLSFWS